MVIIFPLREKFGPVMRQQHPRWTGWRGIPELPALPWNDEDRPPQINFGRVDCPPTAAYMLPSNFGLCALGLVSVQRKLLKVSPYSYVTRYPSVVHELKPMPAVFYTISGISKDSTGAVLGNCVVKLFETNTDFRLHTGLSNADGNYYFKVKDRVTQHYVVSYKAGSPDVAGTSVNTLVGV